jgi:hypothetical protein
VAFELQGTKLLLVVGQLMVDVEGENKEVGKGYLRKNTAFIFTNAGGALEGAVVGGMGGGNGVQLGQAALPQAGRRREEKELGGGRVLLSAMQLVRPTFRLLIPVNMLPCTRC